MHKKPHGELGSYKAQRFEDGSVDGVYSKIELPSLKSDKERLLAEWFVKAKNMEDVANFQQPEFRGFTQNPENDLDLTLDALQGSVYLELIEAAPLTGPYETASEKYKPYEFAKKILSSILVKSESYKNCSKCTIYLLIYATHFSFTLSETAIKCLKVWLANEKHVFTRIYYYVPSESDEGTQQCFFPDSLNLHKAFDPESIRENVCHNINLKEGTVINNNSVGIIFTIDL